jgi:DNA-binding transcriptional regulator GbsR (MarR family)
LDLIARRPCTLDDVMKITGAKENEIDICLRKLIEQGSIVSTRFYGETYYKVCLKGLFDV